MTPHDQPQAQPGALPRFMAFAPFDSADEMHAGFHRPDASCQDGCTPVEIRVLGAHPSDSTPTDDAMGELIRVYYACGLVDDSKLVKPKEAAKAIMDAFERLLEGPTVMGLTPQEAKLVKYAEIYDSSVWDNVRDEDLPPIQRERRTSKQLAALVRRLSASTAGADALFDFVSEIADFDCTYGDNCPPNSGTRHGDCLPCKARRALSSPTKDQA